MAGEEAEKISWARRGRVALEFGGALAVEMGRYAVQLSRDTPRYLFKPEFRRWKNQAWKERARAVATALRLNNQIDRITTYALARSRFQEGDELRKRAVSAGLTRNQSVAKAVAETQQRNPVLFRTARLALLKSVFAAPIAGGIGMGTVLDIYRQAKINALQDVFRNARGMRIPEKIVIDQAFLSDSEKGSEKREARLSQNDRALYMKDGALAFNRAAREEESGLVLGEELSKHGPSYGAQFACEILHPYEPGWAVLPFDQKRQTLGYEQDGKFTTKTMVLPPAGYELLIENIASSRDDAEKARCFDEIITAYHACKGDYRDLSFVFTWRLLNPSLNIEECLSALSEYKNRPLGADTAFQDKKLAARCKNQAHLIGHAFKGFAQFGDVPMLRHAATQIGGEAEILDWAKRIVAAPAMSPRKRDLLFTMEAARDPEFDGESFIDLTQSVLEGEEPTIDVSSEARLNVFAYLAQTRAGAVHPLTLSQIAEVVLAAQDSTFEGSAPEKPNWADRFLAHYTHPSVRARFTFERMKELTAEENQPWGEETLEQAKQDARAAYVRTGDSYEPPQEAANSEPVCAAA